MKQYVMYLTSGNDDWGVHYIPFGSGIGLIAAVWGKKM